MKKRLDNILKAWFTSLAGIATVALSLFLVWKGTFDFVWEGIGGLAIGTILLLAPRTIEKNVSRWIDSLGKSEEDCTPK